MQKPLVLLFLLTTVACAVEVTETIPAEVGGRITLNDSVLEIPANALPTDTEVSMRLDSIDSIDAFAPLQDADDEVLTIEPAAIVLAVPGTLTIALGTPVDGETVVAHHLRDGVWTAIESEVLESGLVQAAVSALGSFALTRSAQPQDSGRVSGVLRWGDGTPVDAAPVELHRDGARLSETVTGADGSFTFADLPPGDYTIVVSFECELEEAISVIATAPTEVELSLCSFE